LRNEVKNLDAHLAAFTSMGSKIVRPPLPAVAFGGRRIAWVVTKNKLVMEFLERERTVDRRQAGW
jgi:hypothetical protein